MRASSRSRCSAAPTTWRCELGGITSWSPTGGINLFHRDVTTFLAEDNESGFLERFAEFCAGDVRQLAHTETSTLASFGSPIVRSTSSLPQVSMYSSIASFRFTFAISIVSPWEVTGKSRQRATNHLPSNWIAALSFRMAQTMYHGLCVNSPRLPNQAI